MIASLSSRGVSAAANDECTIRPAAMPPAADVADTKDRLETRRSAEAGRGIAAGEVAG
jgi:hypothetical protein